MNLRNVAIIAHVDHGKTTLVDQLFRQSGTFRDNQRVEERAMDSNDLEKERGITILAKCTSVEWPDANGTVTHINIVDTPGHADFGAEVERILSMVDGVILLVDSAEGPMPQTKFVTGKALALGLKPIVVVNKIDRPDARPAEVLDEVFELFLNLEANDEQLDFPTLYASGRAGYAGLTDDVREGDLTPMFETIVKHVPAPNLDTTAEFKMLATLLDRDPFLGRILTGRIESGTLNVNMPIRAMDVNGNVVEDGRATKVFAFRGLERVPVETAQAGDIVAIAGLMKATVSNTIGELTIAEPLHAREIDPPTLSMSFAVNDSPFAGKDGDKVQSRVIRDRLAREAEGNVAIRVSETPGGDGVRSRRPRRASAWRADRDAAPRGLRAVDQPPARAVPRRTERPRGALRDGRDRRRRRILRHGHRQDGDAQGRDDRHAPVGRRQDPPDLLGAEPRPDRLSRRIPVRHARHRHHEPAVREVWPIQGPDLRAARTACSSRWSRARPWPMRLSALEDRGILFITPGEMLYEGMVIGENAKTQDLEVNPLKSKQLTNFRASGPKDEGIRLTPPRRMTLEQAIAYIQDDELVEVTPKAIRIRKRYLDPHERKRASRKMEAA